MNLKRISENIKLRNEDTGTISLSEWRLNAQETELTTEEQEPSETYKHFLSVMRPKQIWITLD